MPDRKHAPPRGPITRPPYIKPQAILLDNGLPVYFLQGGTDEFVKVELSFNSGSFHQEKALEAFAATHLLRTGSQSKSRQEINELLDYLSVHLQPDPQKDLLSVSIYVLNKHLDAALPLLSEILRQPLYPREEMDSFLKNQEQLHLINQKKVQHLARTYFTELIYGEQHPYGYRLKPEDFRKLTREDLLSFHRKWIHPNNAFMLVSGRLPVGIEAAVDKNFGPSVWKEGSLADPPSYPMLSSGRRKVYLEMPEALQSAIRIGKQLFNRTHPAYHRLKITNALLGGYFGSRLMQNIRQEKGYTYGISSNVISLLRNGYFFIATQVGSEVAKAARDEIYNELGRLAKVPATTEELDGLRNYLAGSFLRSFDGPIAQGDRFKELLVFGLDHSHYDEYLNTLKHISPGEIMECARLYLDEGEMMEVVAGRGE